MITTYFKNLVMDNLFHTAASKAFPNKYYLAWSTAVTPENSTDFTEPAASTGYSRVEVTGLKDAVDGTVANSTKLEFPESTAHQGTAAEYGIFDASAGGNLLIFKAFAEDDKKTVEKGTTLSIKPNEFQQTLKGL